MLHPHSIFILFFFNDTATTEIYTLSLHDALPISTSSRVHTAAVSPKGLSFICATASASERTFMTPADRKSTRLNSSHLVISYAVFCLKKKKKKPPTFVLVHVITSSCASYSR